MPSLCLGRIITVKIDDPQRRNPKPRPAVIVSKTDEILPGAKIVVAAITTTFTTPHGPDQIPLPWQHQGHRTTKLNKPCVAKCDWLRIIDQSEVRKVGGMVPDARLRQILARIAGKSPRPNRP